ncbi:hypothetical protein [Nostoc sp.]|uniref:hypothetical protein n=1 Tax=Nostoc sp. TaxID=1180 RepID=UPI002FFD0F2C
MNIEDQESKCFYGKDLEKSKDSDVRGSLKLEASTSKPITSAGEEISIYVVIRNPFSVPVRILSTETHIPVDINDQLAKKGYRKKIEESRRELLKEKTSHLIGIKKESLLNIIKCNFFLQDIFQAFLSLEIFQIFGIFRFFQIESDERVAVAVSPEEEESVGSLRYLDIPIVNVNSSDGTVNAYLTNKIQLTINSSDGIVNLNTGDTEENNLLKQTHQGDEAPLNENENSVGFSDKFGLILYPGDSLVKHFVLKTRVWLFFSPVSHTFQIQVRYRIDDRNHIDTIPFSVDIRSPMRSSIVGAIIGSILGFIVSDNKNYIDFSSRSFWLSISRTIIFALIIIVAFARKSNVQQVVSVEDFWGGLFTGFLVGYSGDTFIKSILGAGNGESSGKK